MLPEPVVAGVLALLAVLLVVRNAWDVRKLPHGRGETTGVPGTVLALGSIGVAAFVLVTVAYPVLYLLGRLSILTGSVLQLGFFGDTAVQVAGIAVLATGLALAFWSLYAIRPGTLTTIGPYALARHPMYTGYSLAFAGLFLLTLNLIALPSLLAVPSQVAVARGEERQLAARHGEAYRAYASRTGRFFPRLRG